ncbi:glycosyltransferase [Paremcibacter congregatus]|uniref:glycosyltransferase n=1 Tax=Paremcibacter congregatus TaxID=2043170 RepID=UPI003A905E41
MRILTFTSLYPNDMDPRLGIFVKNRMCAFDALDGVSRTVIAPVHYVPLLGFRKGTRFYRNNQIRLQENQDGIAVWHPRYLTLPGTNFINVADAMAKAGEKCLPDAYPDAEDFDLVDGHYLYPDGVAAYHLAKTHDKPLVLTARGSDVNYWMEQDKPCSAILEALTYARKIICVSQALKDRLIGHGVPAEKLTVLLNGVDPTFFAAAHSTEIEKNHLITVGNLVPLKGHRYILEALVQLPQCRLTIIGTGEREGRLKALAEKLDISPRVTFLSHVPHADLPRYYAAAHCSILMSSREGMPNVVLESLAAGTPVVATNVGGIPEVITAENGILLPERNADALVDAVNSALAHPWNRQQISQNMRPLNWPETAKALRQIFTDAL